MRVQTRTWRVGRCAPRALIVQNVARAGTEAFKARCERDERIALHVWQLDAVSPLDAAPHVAAPYDSGVYELWELRFDADCAAL